ncbi:MAG: macro domain-containing protein [Coriobacteriales bacterium]|nr:macro domain-containing protein [Coriobacteriales bacterium]
MSIELVRGDITTSSADAIVNAANSRLSPGGGVSGAIHRAGGTAVTGEAAAWVAEHGPLATGDAAITSGGHLPARYVIHTVGPVWNDGGSGEAEALASSYRRSIEVAEAQGDITSIAFPSISTGIFGYPVRLAAPVAIRAVAAALDEAHRVKSATFVLFDPATLDEYRQALAAAGLP